MTLHDSRVPFFAVCSLVMHVLCSISEWSRAPWRCMIRGFHSSRCVAWWCSCWSWTLSRRIRSVSTASSPTSRTAASSTTSSSSTTSYRSRYQSISILWSTCNVQLITSASHRPQTNALRPWLIIVLKHGSIHIDQRHIITNRRSSFLCLEGACRFYTMLIHIASHRGNWAWTLNEYPSFTKSINHGLRT